MRDRRSLWGFLAASSAVLGLGLLVVDHLDRTRPAPAPTPLASQRVALIGDSYAVGLSPELAKRIPGLFSRGVVGVPTGFWARRLDENRDVADFRPTLVLVALGVNDGSPNSADYQQVVAALRALGAHVVWIPPPAGVHKPSTLAVRETIASLGVPVFPATNTPLANDGLHPRSYAAWAEELASSLRAA